MELKKEVETIVAVEIDNGYYFNQEMDNYYLINGTKSIIIKNHRNETMIYTEIYENDIDYLVKAVQIDKNKFEAELEKAFEIIREKL